MKNPPKLLKLITYVGLLIAVFVPTLGVVAQELAPEYDSPYVEEYISDENMERVDSAIAIVSSPSTTYSVLLLFALLAFLTCYFAVISILVMIIVGSK